MMTPKTTSRGGQPAESTRRFGLTVAHGAQLLGIFVLSLVATLTVTHLIINSFSPEPVTVSQWAQSSVLWIVVTLACLITVGVGSMIFMIRVSRTREEDGPFTLPESPIRSDVEEIERTVSPRSGQILRLTRSAERLDDVEQDLIRSIAHQDRLNPGTQKLLTEMRVCTRRLLGELNDIDRLKQTAMDNPTRQEQEPAGV
jgi:hypothetical protein